MFAACPLYPQKQTFVVATALPCPEALERGIVAVELRAVKGCPMSALGH